MKRQERLNDLQTSLRLALDDRQAHMWTSIPAIVTSVNLEAQTIEAQPAVQAIITDREGNESNINLPLVVDVPIVWPRAGGFSLTFPIKPGDEVLINFASRCIDSWWQSGDIGAQVEKRMHDLSDGFAILAPTSQPNKLSNVSSTSVQLRTDGGAAYIEIDDSGNIKIINQTQIDIESPTINFTGDVNIDGDVVGTGTIDAQTGIISSGKAFNGHTHSAVQTGGDISGPPV